MSSLSQMGLVQALCFFPSSTQNIDPIEESSDHTLKLKIKKWVLGRCSAVTHFAWVTAELSNYNFPLTLNSYFSAFELLSSQHFKL